AYGQAGLRRRWIVRLHKFLHTLRPHRAFKTAGVQSCLFGSVNHGVVRGSQKEAYGRLLHTLCAAALIGATSLTFSSMGAFWYGLGKVLARSWQGLGLAAAGGVVLFFWSHPQQRRLM
ncbi:hypothetical protein, partial [Melaminivora jejuensis]